MCYALGIELILTFSEKDLKDIDGSMGFVEYLTLIFGGMAILKILFAVIHILSFKCFCIMKKTGYRKRRWSDIKDP